MPVYKIKTPDGRIMKIKGDYPPPQDVVEEAYAKLPPLETQQVKEETLVKNIKTVDDINPFHLYSPFYIPFLVLVVLSILIIKKKIKSGWARIGACLSIIWTLFCILVFFFQSPSSLVSYNSAINIVFSAFICLIPFVLFFILYMTVKWIQEGFEEDKNNSQNLS